jgi:hypothetical protein
MPVAAAAAVVKAMLEVEGLALCSSSLAAATWALCARGSARHSTASSPPWQASPSPHIVIFNHYFVLSASIIFVDLVRFYSRWLSHVEISIN